MLAEKEKQGIALAETQSLLVAMLQEERKKGIAPSMTRAEMAKELNGFLRNTQKIATLEQQILEKYGKNLAEISHYPINNLDRTLIMTGQASFAFAAGFTALGVGTLLFGDQVTVSCGKFLMQGAPAMVHGMIEMLQSVDVAALKPLANMTVAGLTALGHFIGPDGLARLGDAAYHAIKPISAALPIVFQGGAALAPFVMRLFTSKEMVEELKHSKDWKRSLQTELPHSNLEIEALARIQTVADMQDTIETIGQLQNKNTEIFRQLYSRARMVGMRDKLQLSADNFCDAKVSPILHQELQKYMDAAKHDTTSYIMTGDFNALALRQNLDLNEQMLHQADLQKYGSHGDIWQAAQQNLPEYSLRSLADYSPERTSPTALAEQARVEKLTRLKEELDGLLDGAMKDATVAKTAEEIIKRAEQEIPKKQSKNVLKNLGKMTR